MPAVPGVLNVICSLWFGGATSPVPRNQAGDFSTAIRSASEPADGGGARRWINPHQCVFRFFQGRPAFTDRGRRTPVAGRRRGNNVRRQHVGRDGLLLLPANASFVRRLREPGGARRDLRPGVTLQTFTDEEEAFALASHVSYGLAAGVHTAFSSPFRPQSAQSAPAPHPLPVSGARCHATPPRP